MANDLKLRVLLNAIDNTTGPLKRIMGGSNKAAHALKATRDRLKELNSQQKDVSAWRTQRAAAEQTEKALSAARTKVKALSQQISAASAPTKALSNDFKRAVRDASNLKQQHQQQSAQLQALRSRLSAAGISTKNLSSHERNLRSQIASANASISDQTNRLKRLAAQQERLKRAKAAYGKGVQTTASMAGTGMAARATGMYAGEKLRTMLGVGYDFDAIMSSTQAVTRVADKNSEAMQALRNQARTLPLSSKFTDSQVAQGQYFLGRTGYDPKQILGAMPGMLNLAAAGDMELGETADIASNIQTAMGIPAEQMGKVADVLTAAFTRNNVDIRMLGESLKYSAGVGREYGQSLETVTAATALLGNAGVQGSMAGTAMRSVLTRIGTSKAVAKLGVNTQDKSGNMRDMLDILKDINEKTKGMGNVQRGAVYKDIAGQYAVTSFGTLMRSVETGQFQSMRGSLNNSEGEASRVAQTQLDNLKGDMTMLHAALENISVELFDKNSPWLRELAADLSSLLHSVGEFLKANPAVSKAIVITVGGFALLMTTLGSLTIGLAGILGPMIAMRFMLASVGIRLPGIIGLLKLLGTGVRLLSGILIGPLMAGLRMVGIAMWGLAANPVVLAIAAVVAVLAGAAYLIYKNWDAVKAYVISLWNEIKAGFSGGIGGIVTVLANFSPIGIIYRAFAEVLNYLGLDLPTQFTEFGNMIVNGLVNGLLAGMGKVKETISAIGDSTIGWFKEKLDIHSPSRVFAELGGFTMEGLTQGLQAGQKGALNAVTNLGQQLTTAGSLGLGVAVLPGLSVDTRAPISTAASTTYDSHDNYEINIHPTPGMDALAIGRAVRAELARIESEKGARKRSQLSDLE
ncbi:phage tail tape measure protein [Pseudomonas sp. LD120]|uniref:phage tail tape measure protein n=1 Tax=Pseudomonas sp. LD120 TaxID=485751 RepID=UPI00135BBBA7|nr:phage tail tape measure protein [Pseudomonas sp. LD120]KAF0863951.1 phage tail tape measure protein [Pseudomonas sp. LD120]